MLATTAQAPTRGRPLLPRARLPTACTMQSRAFLPTPTPRARRLTTRPRRTPLKVYQVLDLSSAPPPTATTSLDPAIPPTPSPDALLPPSDPSTPPATALAALTPTATPPAYIPPALFAAFQWYATCLDTRPVLTKSLTALVGFCLGDALAQSIEGTHPTLDVARCLRLGSYGLVLDGPVQHFWYRFLDRSVWPEDSTSMKAVIAKTAADQLLWSPLMTCVFFTWLKVLEGHPEAVVATLHAKVLPTLAANYLFWPLVHMFNFRYIPTEWRVLYNQVMCIAWIGFVSVLTHHGITISNWSF